MPNTEVLVLSLLIIKPIRFCIFISSNQGNCSLMIPLFFNNFLGSFLENRMRFGTHNRENINFLQIMYGVCCIGGLMKARLKRD